MKQYVFLLVASCLALLGCGVSSMSGPTASMVAITPAMSGTSTVHPTPRATSTQRPTSTPVIVGRTRELPMPLGRSVSYEDGVQLTVLGLVNDAAEIIRESSVINPKAVQGEKWVMVMVEYKCAATSGTCRFSTHQFQLVGSRGIAYRIPILVLPQEFEPTQELYPGATSPAVLTFLVKETDMDFVIVWDRGPLWPTAYLSVD